MTRAGIYGVLSVVLWVGQAHAVTDGEKCEAGKNKIAGKYAMCRQLEEAKAVKAGTAADFTKCDSSYDSQWLKAEDAAGGACPSSGDQNSVRSMIEAHANAVAAALGGAAPPECGNGSADPGEVCDGEDLRGATCQTQGFLYGALECAACAVDTSGCTDTRFIDNADGTISDNQTGLTWEKKVARNQSQDTANEHDSDNTYRWAGTCSQISKSCQPNAAAAALCAANVEGDPTGCDECTGSDGVCSDPRTAWAVAADLNAAAFGGYTDWRIPTRGELIPLIDYEDASVSFTDLATDEIFFSPLCASACTNPAFQLCGGPVCTDINSLACSCSALGYYLSASTVAYQTSAVWTVNFGSADISRTGKSNVGFLRLVRSGS